MMEIRRFTDMSAEYSDLEQKILQYLYEHPGWNASTGALMEVFRTIQATAVSGTSSATAEEVAKGNFDEVQYAVETLVKDEIVKGKRAYYGTRLQWQEIELTSKGERKAIQLKRDTLEITVTTPLDEPEG